MGFDYFGARYLASAQGRWTSLDAPFADQDASDPQSWNLYSYVRSQPLNSIDLDGRIGLKNDEPLRQFFAGVAKGLVNAHLENPSSPVGALLRSVGVQEQSPSNAAQQSGMDHSDTVVGVVMSVAPGGGGARGGGSQRRNRERRCVEHNLWGRQGRY